MCSWGLSYCGCYWVQVKLGWNERCFKPMSFAAAPEYATRNQTGTVQSRKLLPRWKWPWRALGTGLPRWKWHWRALGTGLPRWKWHWCALGTGLPRRKWSWCALGTGISFHGYRDIRGVKMTPPSVVSVSWSVTSAPLIHLYGLVRHRDNLNFTRVVNVVPCLELNVIRTTNGSLLKDLLAENRTSE
jgi:hypothetical protein